MLSKKLLFKCFIFVLSLPNIFSTNSFSDNNLKDGSKLTPRITIRNLEIFVFKCLISISYNWLIRQICRLFYGVFGSKGIKICSKGITLLFRLVGSHISLQKHWKRSLNCHIPPARLLPESIRLDFSKACELCLGVHFGDTWKQVRRIVL